MWLRGAGAHGKGRSESAGVRGGCGGVRAAGMKLGAPLCVRWGEEEGGRTESETETAPSVPSCPHVPFLSHALSVGPSRCSPCAPSCPAPPHHPPSGHEGRHTETGGSDLWHGLCRDAVWPAQSHCCPPCPRTWGERGRQLRGGWGRPGVGCLSGCGCAACEIWSWLHLQSKSFYLRLSCRQTGS